MRRETTEKVYYAQLYAIQMHQHVAAVELRTQICFGEKGLFLIDILFSMQVWYY